MLARLSSMLRNRLVGTQSSVRTVGFPGDCLPRTCGIATFTSNPVLPGQLEEAPKRVRALATTYAAFLNYAFNPQTARGPHHMNRFRNQGHVSYSRQGIRLHRDTLRKLLDGSGCLSADRNDQYTYALANDMPAED
jgi:hypothetical protein